MGKVGEEVNYDEKVRNMRLSAEWYKAHNVPSAAKRLADAADTIEELLHLHQLDMAEIVRLRREVEARG